MRASRPKVTRETIITVIVYITETPFNEFYTFNAIVASCGDALTGHRNDNIYVLFVLIIITIITILLLPSCTLHTVTTHSWQRDNYLLLLLL